MSKVQVDNITGPPGPPGAAGAPGGIGPAGPTGPPGVVDATELRKIDCVIRYDTVQPARSTGTSDPLRRVRWVSNVEPITGGIYALDGDIWESVAAVVPPAVQTIVRSTPQAPSHAYWSGTPIVKGSILIPAGAALVVESSDSSDNTGSSATSTPQLTNSGTARPWTLIANGLTSQSRIWTHYWFNDTGSDVTLDLTVTWGPDIPSSNFACGVALQLLENVADPTTTAPVFAVVNSGSDVAASLSSPAGSQVLLAFDLTSSDAVAIGTDYLSGTTSDSSPASNELFTGEMSYGWVFRSAPESAAGSHTVGMNTPHPLLPLAIAVAFAAAAV